jgi:hypothetical protein
METEDNNNNKWFRKYKSICEFRKNISNECIHKSDFFEKENCNDILKLIDKECKRIEKMMNSK